MWRCQLQLIFIDPIPTALVEAGKDRGIRRQFDGCERATASRINPVGRMARQAIATVLDASKGMASSMALSDVIGLQAPAAPSGSPSVGRWQR
jgi:hypothetical protein